MAVLMDLCFFCLLRSLWMGWDLSVRLKFDFHFHLSLLGTGVPVGLFPSSFGGCVSYTCDLVFLMTESLAA